MAMISRPSADDLKPLHLRGREGHERGGTIRGAERPDGRNTVSSAWTTSTLTSREGPHERHDGYTHKDVTSEHPGPAFSHFG